MSRGIPLSHTFQRGVGSDSSNRSLSYFLSCPFRSGCSCSATVVHESFPQSSKTGDASSMVTEISDLEKKEQPVVHQPPTAAAAELITWLNESCGFSDDEVTLYTEAFMELGIDKPEHLQMIDGEEVAWPSIVKPVHRKRIQASLEPGTSMASPRSREGSLVSDRI